VEGVKKPRTASTSEAGHDPVKELVADRSVVGDLEKALAAEVSIDTSLDWPLDVVVAGEF